MEYRRFGNKIIARIDKGEEILTTIKEISLKENIKLASVQALGATDEFTVGVYKVDEKKYYANEFKGYFEIVSLTGTINTMNGEFYTHIHMSAGNDKGEVFGGHLNKAIVCYYMNKRGKSYEKISNFIPGSKLQCGLSAFILRGRHL